jgi:sugar phosphate isomerase/epimerase
VLDPHPERRKKAQNTFHKTIELASMLGVDIVVAMSGCPGDPTGGEYPNWVTCFWQHEYYVLLERQWNEEICPFWAQAGKFAASHGVRIAIEMHHGQAVYNTRTFLRLRAAAGPSVGVNLDPSHLFPQGMDPLVVLKALGRDGVFYVHAKDSKINPQLAALNGVMDRRILVDPVAELSWAYRTTGYGHGEEWWRDFVSNLQMIGYKGVLSIEHEDELMGMQEGILKSFEFLKRIVLTTDAPS